VHTGLREPEFAVDTHSQRIAYFPSLTGLRGIAALSVTVFHLWQFVGRPTLWLGGVERGYPLHALAACGFLGVDLFFVLSGFLLALPFLAAVRGERPWPALPTYFARRALRVLPALWVQIPLLFLAGWVVLGRPPFGLRTALLDGLFLQHLVSNPGVVNAVYWTLPVEWWFYFTLPFAARAFAYVRWWLLLAAVLVWVFVFRLWCWEWLYEGRWDVGFNYGAIMFLRARYDQFFLGMLAAWFHLATPKRARWRSLPGALALIGMIALVPSVAARGDLFVHADYPWVLVHYSVVAFLLAALVYSAAGGVRWLDRLFANATVCWLGLVSYSLYLWHYPILEWMQRAHAFDNGRAPLAAVLALVVALAVAWLSYRFVERPFLREPVRLIRSVPAPEA
jgi:peptidoglycan/LPS O-acetylase OafA/YrhL